MTEPSNQTERPADDFAAEAGKANRGLLGEMWQLLIHNKKWWLVPIIVVLLVIGLLVALGSSALAPFIYPLF